jgi:hypothetical protein
MNACSPRETVRGAQRHSRRCAACLIIASCGIGAWLCVTLLYAKGGWNQKPCQRSREAETRERDIGAGGLIRSLHIGIAASLDLFMWA